MARLAIRNLPDFEISTFEIDEEKVSYTINTMRAFRKKNPEYELFFIIGDDSLNQLHTWKCIDELLQICRFITISRPDADGNRVDVNPKFSDSINKQLLADRIEACNLEISSTYIRECVRCGKSIKNLVPATVADYIQQNELYLT